MRRKDMEHLLAAAALELELIKNKGQERKNGGRGLIHALRRA